MVRHSWFSTVPSCFVPDMHWHRLLRSWSNPSISQLPTLNTQIHMYHSHRKQSPRPHSFWRRPNLRVYCSFPYLTVNLYLRPFVRRAFHTVRLLSQLRLSCHLQGHPESPSFLDHWPQLWDFKTISELGGTSPSAWTIHRISQMKTQRSLVLTQLAQVKQVMN